MMKLIRRIHIYIVSLIVLVSCTDEVEKIVTMHPNGKPAYVEYFTKEDSLSPVRTLRYYFNGEKEEEIHYKDGVKHGKNTFWYQNGEKMYEGNYVDGLMDGVFTQWFNNGNVDYIAEYTQGRPSGTWRYYKNDGTLLKEQKMQ